MKFALIMRRILLVAALIVAVSPAVAADTTPELRDFARAVGLSDVDGFIDTVEALRTGHRLPPRYLSKRQAERLGWRPGLDLCRLTPAEAIGGDRFRDRQHVLPDAAGRRWREADLDERCARDRGPHRLIWSNDGLIYVTTDHYRSFIPVPAAPSR